MHNVMKSLSTSAKHAIGHFKQTASQSLGVMSFIDSIISLMTNAALVKSVYVDNIVGGMLVTFLERSCSASFSSGICYDSLPMYVQPLKRIQRVVFKRLGDNAKLFFVKGAPIIISKRPLTERRTLADVHRNDPDGSSSSANSYVITFIRGTFDVDRNVYELIDMEMSMRVSGQTDRYVIHRIVGDNKTTYDGDEGPVYSPRPPSTNAGHFIDADSDLGSILSDRCISGASVLGWTYDQLGTPIDRHIIDVLSMSDKMHALIADVRRWFAAKDKYASKQIPWRRGYLLHGRPGTGKTSIVRALAQSLNVPVYSYDITSLSNVMFTGSWQKMLHDAPCIALIEDIDSAFNKRKNVVKSLHRDVLTFDCLLNALDGVAGSNGVLMFITANDVSKVDSALAVSDHSITHDAIDHDIPSRPGRIDMVVELGNIDVDGMRKMAHRIFDSADDADALVERIVRSERCVSGAGLTPAEFQEICIRTYNALAC